MRRRSWWAWGWLDAEPTGAERAEIGRSTARTLGLEEVRWREPVPFEDLQLPRPRLTAPSALAPIVTDDPYERARRAHGRAYDDVVRGFYGEFADSPDVVASPANAAQVAQVLEWCSDAGAAVVPFGGGTSVVDGVSGGGDWAAGFAGVVTLDLTQMDQVLEIDHMSRAARVQAGVFGPRLEAQLKPHGLTLRHFMQSFEFSTLGGWLATRAGGHYATLHTHIDDLTESITMVTPAGTGASARVPASGAGPSPDRLALGSEGTLGVITEAWMRLQDRPTWRSSAAVRFPGLDAAVAAVRRVSQSALFPTNCRLLDDVEAAGVSPHAEPAPTLLLGFESADHPVDDPLRRALGLCREHGGALEEQGDAAGSWRTSFVRAPYLSSTMVRMGVLSETFETACTWDRFPSLHEAVLEAAREVLGKYTEQRFRLSSRFTHVYPDGPAPYYTVRAAVGHGNELAAHHDLKQAFSETFAAQGGTITHHHAVGRTHRPWYDAQVPTWFRGALQGAKRSTDPVGVLNPGVLVDPVRS